ncbi:ribonuclease P protein component [bacterium]|nr:ribonuclease P protein component [bacterium]
MLPKENRLKKQKDFDRVFGKGESYKTNFFTIRFVENNLDKTRFGFVVSKKIHKKAVVRNKNKRRLREIIRKMLPDIKQGIDAVIIVKKDLSQEDFQAIERQVKELLKNTKLLNAEEDCFKIN